MSLINVTNLTFAYDGSYDNIFENANFQIDTNWKLGFVGRNGRGKTTFLNLLLGKYEYKGSISASTEFEYFPFAVEDDAQTGLEIAENMLPELEYWRLSRELSLLEVDDEILYRPYQTLSNGEQTKLLLAILFLRENCFLLIDEPTNHLDMHGRETVSRYLRSKKGFILVSHDRAFLDGCVDHILSINKASIEVQKGNFSSWHENKMRQDAFELAENEKLKKEISRLEKTAREKAQWSERSESGKIGLDHDKKSDAMKNRRSYEGEKARKMMSRAKAIENRTQNAIDEKSKLLKNLERSDELKISQLEYHSSRLALLEDVEIAYGEIPVCSGVSFPVEKGERIALCGKNGCGKSSLLKLILGQDIPHSGNVRIGSGIKISYVPQNTSGLRGNLRDYANERGIDESLFKAILRKLDFSRTQFDKDISDFSAGQKKKVLIAASLCEKAHLHIWDEPLNYIDVISRIQIESLILDFNPTMIFVEHDREFCEKIATKKIQL